MANETLATMISTLILSAAAAFVLFWSTGNIKLNSPNSEVALGTVVFRCKFVK